MSDTPPNPLEGLLSQFALGPSWARAKPEPVAKKFKESAEREFKPRRENDRRDDRRGSQDSRGRQPGGRRDFGKPERERQEFQHEEITPAEGVTVTLLPDPAAIQLIIKEIQHVARVYPLFDVSQIILAERSRCRAVFETSDKVAPLLQCKFEEAVFVTKEEALRHLIQAPWRNRFIEEAKVEIDPPKGNFQSVARCGISGEWLGPPNFHAYQTEIRRIHRERFPDMRFESYVAKICTERGEEAVNSWLNSMRTQTRWRILADDESKAVAAEMARPAEAPKPKLEPVAAESVAADCIRPADTETEPSPSKENSIPPAEEPVSEEEIPATEEPAADTSEPELIEEAPTPKEPALPEVKWFTDRAEFERALIADVIDKAFHPTRKAKVSAAIPGKNLSPGLLVRLKGTGSHHRKHPAILIPVVCKMLENEHMAVFKRKGKLFTGPARPHSLAADAVLAPRPAEMVKWIRENNPAKLEGLWTAVLPAGAIAPPAEYAADLFWLLQQGHILLYADDTLVVQEVPKPQEPKMPKAPKPRKKKTKPKSEESTSTAEHQAETPPDDAPTTADEPQASIEPEPLEASPSAATEEIPTQDPLP